MNKFTIMVKRPTIVVVEAQDFEDAKKKILSNLIGSGQMKPNELIEFEEITEMVEIKKEKQEDVENDQQNRSSNNSGQKE